jgi:hypothetical protein
VVVRIQVLVGILASFGIAFTVGPFAARALETLAEVPASTYVAAGLIPAMLVGQLITMKQRSRR